MTVLKTLDGVLVGIPRSGLLGYCLCASMLAVPCCGMVCMFTSVHGRMNDGMAYMLIVKVEYVRVDQHQHKPSLHICLLGTLMVRFD
jgi:hypothetical protein